MKASKTVQIFKKTRFALAYPLIVLLFLLAQTTGRTLLWGIALAVLGEGLRIWANGYVGHVKVNRTLRNAGQDRIGTLITGGPYRYVRHPLYLGTFLIALGLCVAANNWWIGILMLAAYIVVYKQKMDQEDALLMDELNEAYSPYFKAVSQWLPHLRPYSKHEGRWVWQGIVSSKEWKTLLGVAALFALFVLFLNFH